MCAARRAGSVGATAWFPAPFAAEAKNLATEFLRLVDLELIFIFNNTNKTIYEGKLCGILTKY